MDFTTLNINDYQKYQNYFLVNDLYKSYLSSELNFPVLYVWQNFQSTQNYITDDYIIIKAKNGDFFVPPLAKTKGSFVLAVTKIREYCRRNNVAPKISYLDENLKNFLLDNFECGKAQLDRDLSEYIYSVNDLINFEGKKYHAKKNHLNQFEKYDYFVKKYDDACFDSIMEIIKIWDSLHQNTAAENDAIILSLKNYKQLKMICELVYVKNKIAGFAIGCVCNNDLGMILFEKADINYKGIYVKINNSFIKNNFSDLKYVSFQEDMGDEGLRKSKMSYHPAFLEHKYTLILK